MRRFRPAYDPLFSYYGWRNKSQDPHWVKNLQSWHAYYRAHPDARLPHDLAAAQRAVAEGGKWADRQFLKIADTLPNWQEKPDSPIRLATVSAEQKAQVPESLIRARSPPCLDNQLPVRDA
jgi:hypothetical protein